MNRPIRFFLYKPIVMLCDVSLINVGFLLAFLLLRKHLLQPEKNLASYLNLALLLSLATLLIFHLLDLYRDWLRRSLRHVLYSVLIAVSMTLLATMGIGFWARQFAFPRSVLVLAAFVQAILLCSYRILMRRAYRRWFGNRRTVVIGESEEDACAVVQKFSAHEVGLYRLQGYLLRCDLEPPYQELNAAETVVLSQNLQRKEDIILHCFRYRKEVLVVPNISELTLFGAEAREIDDLLILGIQPHRLNPAEELLKRAADLVGSAAYLLLMSPLLLLVASIIRLTSPGPVLFGQERIGRAGKRFRILKFRTMVDNAEKSSGPVLARKDDPRVTSFGRVLRATRMDELPQLINVIRGEMSLVGPRPERPCFVEQFESMYPAYELRHAVKPGITGLAQVMGSYATSAERKLHFDLLYVYNYSLLLDVKVLMQTIRVVLEGEPMPASQVRITPKRSVPRILGIPPIEHVSEGSSSQSD